MKGCRLSSYIRGHTLSGYCGLCQSTRWWRACWDLRYGGRGPTGSKRPKARIVFRDWADSGLHGEHQRVQTRRKGKGWERRRIRKKGAKTKRNLPQRFREIAPLHRNVSKISMLLTRPTKSEPMRMSKTAWQ